MKKQMGIDFIRYCMLFTDKVSNLCLFVGPERYCAEKNLYY